RTRVLRARRGSGSRQLHPAGCIHGLAVGKGRAAVETKSGADAAVDGVEIACERAIRTAIVGARYLEERLTERLDPVPGTPHSEQERTQIPDARPGQGILERRRKRYMGQGGRRQRRARRKIDCAGLTWRIQHPERPVYGYEQPSDVRTVVSHDVFGFRYGRLERISRLSEIVDPDTLREDAGREPHGARRAEHDSVHFGQPVMEPKYLEWPVYRHGRRIGDAVGGLLPVARCLDDPGAAHGALAQKQIEREHEPDE